MAALHDFCVKPVSSSYFFDGIITVGNTRHYIQKVPFKRLSIAGYKDLDRHTVGSDMWIQSLCGMKKGSEGVWYRLKTPSEEYRRFHIPFLWLADMAKHFLDYLNNYEDMSLDMFSSSFYDWLQQMHGEDGICQEWMAVYGDTDFRRVITAHPLFLRNEAANLNNSYLVHTIWKEIVPPLRVFLP